MRVGGRGERGKLGHGGGGQGAAQEGLGLVFAGCWELLVSAGSRGGCEDSVFQVPPPWPLLVGGGQQGLRMGPGRG